MRVVHVVRQFQPSVGGLEDGVLNLARAQADRHDVRVVTLDRVFTNPGVRLPAQDTVDGIGVTRLPWRGSSRYPIAPAASGAIGGADLVHVHGIDFLFDYLALTRPLHGRRLVASTHGGFFHTTYASKLKRIWFSSVTRTSVRAYGAIVACSDNDATVFGPIAARRLVTIENGVDLAKFAGRASATLQPVLIYFGRLTAHKRIGAALDLLRALRAAADAPAWRLIIAGAPSDQTAASLKDMADRIGVGAAVTVVESPDTGHLARLIGEASYFICPSAHEGFGLAAVEAISAGLLPVLSAIPPFRKLVQRTGFGMLFDPADVTEAAIRLQALHTSGVAVGPMRAWASASLAAYEWSSVVESYDQVYDAVRAGRRPVVSEGPAAVLGEAA